MIVHRYLAKEGEHEGIMIYGIKNIHRKCTANGGEILHQWTTLSLSHV